MSSSGATSRPRLSLPSSQRAKAIRELNRQGIEWPPKPKANDLAGYRDAPVGFVRDILGGDPWAGQAAILEALAREPRVTVRSCNGAGKTLCAAWAALWFLVTRPGSIVVTTAPTGRQVRDLLWRRIRDAYHSAPVSLPGRCLTQQLDCGDNWYATGFATDTEVKFQGPHSPHGVLFVGDEASGLAEWLFAAVQGFMTEPGAKMLLIGNPNQASGTFYESQKNWPAAQKFKISAFDVPEHVLTPGWPRQMLEEWGEESPAYQVRVLGEFPEQGDDSLISLKWVNDAQERDLTRTTDGAPTGPDGGNVVIGVDIGRYGGDESVAYVRSGSAVLDALYWRKNDTMESAGRIASLARQWSPCLVNVDEIGVGAGVLDRLLELSDLRAAKITVSGINVGETASDSEHFANRRSEIFWGLRERFKAGDISIPKDDTLLLAQLVALKFSYTSRGQIKLESKEDIRKNRSESASWRSPDRGDALALAFARPTGYRPVARVGIPRRAR